MLVRFSVSNFLSYDEKQTLSMIAGRTQNHLDHIYIAKDINLLKLCAVYGANASGKSKLFEAMHFASETITSGLSPSTRNMFCKLSPENEFKSSDFEFEIYLNNSFYAYGFSVILSKRRVTAEWLYELNPQRNTQEEIFERIYNESNNTFTLTKGKRMQGLGTKNKNILEAVNDFSDDAKVLFLKELNRSNRFSNAPSLHDIRDVYNYFASNLEFITPDTSIQNIDCYRTSDADFKNFVSAVSSFDTGIIDIRNEHLGIEDLEKLLPEEVLKNVINALEDNTNEKKSCTSVVVQARNSGWYKIEFDKEEQKLDVTTIVLRHKNSAFDFSFSEESDGTRKIFDLLRIVILSKVGGVYIVDELERSLHPKVTERLLDLFIELTKDKDIQLIFTTHESTIMSQELLRRDEIWFVEKNSKNSSSLYSLDRFSERYDRKIDRAYLDGRYGALPIFNDIYGLKE